MLTEKDIQKIVKAGKKVFVTKKDLARLVIFFKEEFDSFQKTIQSQITSVNRLIKATEDLYRINSVNHR